MPKILALTFPDLRLHPRDAPKLRGYFTHHFGASSILFHNHTSEGGYRYKYPLIQYKVLRGIPTVMGVNEGADRLLDVFMDIREIELNGQSLPINAKELDFVDASVGISDTLREYRFAAPYFALNQGNYREFHKLNAEQQRQRLQQLLSNHLIQALRDIGLSITPDGPRLLVSARLQPKIVQFKNQRMQMYTGQFTSNVIFPSGLGIGKSSSRGFGTVEPLRNY